MISRRFRLVVFLLLTSSLALAADKIVDGGSGTDSLTINYSGITSLKDFTLSSYSSGELSYIKAIDSGGNEIDFTRISDLTVNSISYAFSPSTAINSGDGGLSNAFYSTAQKTIHSYGSTIWYAQNIWSGDHSLGFNRTDDIEYIGSASQESINLNIQRGGSNYYAGDLIIDLKDGNDSINSAKLINTDSIDMGDGDDTVSVMFGADAGGYQTIQNANISKLDGGEGTDTLSFGESANPPTTISLTTAGATNFENLTGTTSAETLNGDANANVLVGNGGDDTLNGNGGNDTLYAQSESSIADASSTDSDDNLYGGAGNDILYGSAGDNTLDGGTGADTIYSGAGSDVIVIRSGDGGSGITDADTLSDFSDGVDSIGLASSLTFDDLTISTSGSDTVIVSGSEYLMRLLSTSSSNITYLDFQSTSTEAQTFNGTSINNTLIGGAGVDTFNGGAGNDILIGWGGNDIFNIASKSGSYTDTILGGGGTDTLNIAYSGISSLKDFILSSSGSDITATDSSGGSVIFNGIENLTVNSISYAFSPSTAINSGDGGLSNAFYSTAQKTIHSYGSTIWYAQNIWSGDHSLGFNRTDDIEYIGSASQESINLNIQRGGSNYYAGDLIIDLKDGNDSINSAKLINTDSIDMGDGDDTVSVMFGADAGGYQTIQNANISKLDGGEGTDTLSFGESANPPTTISLTTAGATNFENLTGTTSAETLNGDANANVLVGNGGDDTLNGNGGNDTLYAQSESSIADASSTDSDDNLYGGAGNDILYGSAGDNTLDGGTGADTIYSGAGSDVIVIRSGDGGSGITDADTLSDFSDGVDSIGLASSLTFDDLTISTSGSDTVIVSGSEYLMRLLSTSSSNITYLDFQSTSTEAQTFNGTSINNTLIGGAGVDTFNGGAGNDILIGWGGNDIFNIASKSGSYTDTILGGGGTDTLNIAYSGISSLKDFILSSSGSDITATDSSGGSVIFNGIENLTVNSISYAFSPSTAINSGDGGLSNAFYSTAQKTIHSYGSTIWYAQNIWSGDHSLGFNRTDDIEYIGSASQESINLNIQRGGSNYYAGDLIIDLKDGNDSINSAKLINTDSIDMGDGDDTVSVMFGADAGGYQTIQNANISKLDGGEGTDTLSFGESANPPTTISLTTAGATNFENLTGTTSAETLNGDANANVLVGNGGDDTLNGNGGNDTLYAQSESSIADASSTDSDDNLYGGAGNDILYGSAGDNTLDGGTGADTIYSGAGSDVIVIRSGDGGSGITDADTLSDFSDGVDLIGLSGINYSDLTVEQGSGDYSSHVVVKKTDSGEFLLIIQSQNINNIDDRDFSAI